MLSADLQSIACDMLHVTTCSLPCRSVGAEVNYAIRFRDDADAERFIEKLSEEVEKRMANLGVQGRSLTFKLMRRKVHTVHPMPSHCSTVCVLFY